MDRKTGGLAFTGHFTPVGNPSIIVFLDLAKGGRDTDDDAALRRYGTVSPFSISPPSVMRPIFR